MNKLSKNTRDSRNSTYGKPLSNYPLVKDQARLYALSGVVKAPPLRIVNLFFMLPQAAIKKARNAKRGGMLTNSKCVSSTPFGDPAGPRSLAGFSEFGGFQPQARFVQAPFAA